MAATVVALASDCAKELRATAQQGFPKPNQVIVDRSMIQEVPYKGKVEKTVQSILGGVRSACSYVGARRIKDLPKCSTFVRVTITTNEIYTPHEVG